MESFSNEFVTEKVVTAEEIDFDPFNIGVASSTNAKANGNPVGTATNNSEKDATNTAVADDGKSALSAKTSASSALPPRLMVKFKIQEEVSSTAHISDKNEGSSDVQIEGTVLAQVVSSDALKNIPFSLTCSTGDQNIVKFIPNDDYTKNSQTANDENPNTGTNIVTVPKESFGFVNVGTYRLSQSMEHMPLLLEQKIVHSQSKIQIAIQVRSKLSNPDDLSEFSIVVFIPKQVDEKSVSIVTGDGNFDPWKRCIAWEKLNLPKGQSFMVSAKCEMDNTSASTGGNLDEALKFPVMLRCRSKDQISSVELQAAEVSGHPASVSSSVVGKSYRIVHRLK